MCRGSSVITGFYFFHPIKKPGTHKGFRAFIRVYRISKNLQAHELLGGAAAVLLNPQGVHALGQVAEV